MAEGDRAQRRARGLVRLALYTLYVGMLFGSAWLVAQRYPHHCWTVRCWVTP